MTAASAAAAPAVRFRGVSRRFGGVTALAGVSFDIAAGSCHAICGENGAGKSTLGKILAGIERPDGGSVELFGNDVRFASPRSAMAAGVAIVHQELACCANLSVAENLCLARIPRRGAFVDGDTLRRRAVELLDVVGATIDPDREMGSLSTADQQRVQIASALGSSASIIVFDEPTSSLGDREAERLYELIGALRARGTTVIYVSHRLAEIFRLCDTVTVLRDGAHVTTRAVAGLDEGLLVELMIGRRLAPVVHGATAYVPGETMLEVVALGAAGYVKDVSFTVRAGEVVGLAGLVGAGRSEVAQALFGLDPGATGVVRVRGRRVDIRSPRDAMSLGIGFVPEDRKRLGLVLSLTNGENCSLPTLSRHATGGWVDERSEGEAVSAAFDHVRMGAGAGAATATLSGGNQQKVAFAKWLAADSDILILDEPTRGVDVGAKAELHAWIDGYALAGRAVLLISSDMPELLRLSTRIVVLRDGRIVGELARADATPERVLRLMSGLGAEPVTTSARHWAGGGGGNTAH